MKPRHRLLAIAALLIASLSQAAVPALAQTQPSVGPVQVNLGSTDGGARTLTIPRGRSAIVDLPVDARDVLVTNPQVADAVLRSPRRIYVMGLAPGVTDAAFFDASGRRILALDIRVNQDFSAVGQTINQLIPDAHVRVAAIDTSLVLTGDVRDLTEADRAVQIAQQFTTNPAQVLNMMTIDGKEQVMLKVRIVEMQRSVIKQLGFNLSALIGEASSPQFVAATAPTFGINGALLGGLTGGFQQATASPTSTVQKASALLQAFEQVGVVRTLAEPNLTAVSGESAKFLAGGEFPVPSGISSNGQVSVDFKTFGVGLGFTPVVLSGGHISLKISTEVSELTNQGSFTLSTGTATPTSGTSSTATGSAALTIPGLIVRRAETTVELPSGGSMMIAGLLEEETKQDISSVPGLLNLPVLGPLFNSRDYQEGETELVVIVTPYLVNPASPADLQTPADGFVVANDAQTTLLGRLNKVYKAPPAAVAGKTYQGPVGYVIE